MIASFSAGGNALNVANSSCLCCSFRWLRAVSLSETCSASSLLCADSSSSVHSLCEGAAILLSIILPIFSLLSSTLPSLGFATSCHFKRVINSIPVGSERCFPWFKILHTTTSLSVPANLSFLFYSHWAIRVCFAGNSTAIKMSSEVEWYGYQNRWIGDSEHKFFCFFDPFANGDHNAVIATT